MYGQDDNLKDQIYETYKDDVLKLIKYLPWLSKKSGKDVTSMYTGDEKIQVIPIPVFDSTLLAFVKEAEKTQFIDKNYPYVYTRNNIRTHADELKMIQNAKITDIKIFKAVLSKYVLGGKSKASLWAEGVDSGVFVAALDALNKLFFTNTKDGSQMLRY